MALYEVTDTEIIQRCACCNCGHHIPQSQLLVGVVRGTDVNPLIIPLPACECGAGEFLVRAPDGAPPHALPGSFGHLHGLLVQELHSKLMNAGRALPEVKNMTPPFVAGPPLDLATKQRWFPNGLKIEIKTEGGGNG